jgi:hypothetical protein
VKNLPSRATKTDTQGTALPGQVLATQAPQSLNRVRLGVEAVIALGIHKEYHELEARGGVTTETTGFFRAFGG